VVRHRNPGIDAGSAEMPVIARGRHGNALALCLVNQAADGLMTWEISQPASPVENQHRRRFRYSRDGRSRSQLAVTEMADIVLYLPGPMAEDATKIVGHQQIREQCGLFRRHSGQYKYLADK